MVKKRKVIKTVAAGLCIFLALALAVLGTLFFPLNGKKHIEIWSKNQPFDINKIQTVDKTREDFKILMFTDTQLWSDLSINSKCYDEMDALVKKTQPDLIVLPGDNLSALASRFSIYNFINHMDAYEIPWAPVFGNHDAEIPTTSKNWQADLYIQSEYCLMEKGPSNLSGCGNYVINITENDMPIYTLFMFDNSEYTEYENGETRETWMDYDQIAWYEWNVKGIEEFAGRTIESMTFSHFAFPEFKEAIEKYGIKGNDGSYTIPEEYGYGFCAYLPGTSPVNSGFVEKCKELGSTKYIFCGHDHENNASITADGITYTYGLKTGPSPVPWNHAEETGGTLITLSGSGEHQSVSIENIVITQNKSSNGE